MSIFRTRRDKDFTAMARYMEEYWDVLDEKKQRRFKEDYYPFYMALMYYTKWSRR